MKTSRVGRHNDRMNFVDLFAGLGGFHLALQQLGLKCVFASEIDEHLRLLYQKNFGILPEGDIRMVDERDIPSHQVLCAGFPCQPFSKAGRQEGLNCPKWGDLFDHVRRIIRYHHPEYVLLENVPNLERHRDGQTWESMKQSLLRLGYEVQSRRLSPHEFGIPQIRSRVFIVGSKTGLSGFEWPTRPKDVKLSIRSQLERNPSDARPLSEQVTRCLKTWQKFVSRFPKGEELPSFPIWSMEFGATYPFEEITPFKLGKKDLARYRGSFGTALWGVSPEERLLALPSYARERASKFPDWKIQFIRQNRALYKRHKDWIDRWLPEILEFPSSLQKLEWNCKGEKRDIWRYVIQFRASGVRVKRPTTSPSLIAMTSTQVPIIGWEKRYLTPRECARLQSMERLSYLPESPTRAFEALGNAVNVQLILRIARSLIDHRSNQKRPLQGENGKVCARAPAEGIGAAPGNEFWSRK